MCAKPSAADGRAAKPKQLAFLQIVVGDLESDHLRLGPEVARHLRKSLRAAIGDRVPVTDGRGTRAEAEIRAWVRDGAEVAVGARRQIPAPVRRFWIAARAAGSRFEWLLEKAVELGASGVWPLEARGPGRERGERWLRLVRAAGEQCLTAWLPSLESPAPLGDVLARAGREPWGSVVLADPGGTPAGEVSAERLPAGDHLLLVGPPEGFSPAERGLLAARPGLLRLAFGPRRLRAETAGLAALIWANALGPGPSSGRWG